MYRAQITFHKPIFILDIERICYFYYEFVKKERQDVHDLIGNRFWQKFDNSDYPTNNIYGVSSVYKKILGQMKDEDNGPMFN